MKTEKQTILGQVPSKSNSYRIITIRGHGSIAKTAQCKKYEESFASQILWQKHSITEDVALHVDVYFDSRRPDLDNSLKIIQDCLQKCGVIKNDRQIVEIHARKRLDKVNPRIEFYLEILEGA